MTELSALVKINADTGEIVSVLPICNSDQERERIMTALVGLEERVDDQA